MEKIIADLAVHALKKPIEDLYSLFSEKIERYYKNWIAQENINSSRKRITGSRNVRTIFSGNFVDILDVYYPAKIIISNKPSRVNSIGE